MYLTKSYHFFRWAGSKIWLVKYLDELLPDNFENYHEPFFGGGSMFLAINPKNKNYLSDINTELINAYIKIRDDVDKLWSIIVKLKNNKDDYYRIRKSYSKQNDLEKAAMFIYLNRTSFNGIYRVNLKGKYNVPYGFKKYKTLFDHDKFTELSRKLRNTKLESYDFEQSLKNIKKGDLVYLDPPYTVSASKDTFIKYNEKLFDWESQERLASFLAKLNKRNVKFILSNSYHEKVLDLFSNFGNVKIYTRNSLVGGKKAKRGIYKEIVIKNY